MTGFIQRRFNAFHSLFFTLGLYIVREHIYLCILHIEFALDPSTNLVCTVEIVHECRQINVFQ